jgi:type IV secretory pathway VirB10-like protein
MWLMLGLAGVLLGIILLTGNPTPTDRPPNRPTPLAVDTERVTGFQQQLALRERELARQMAALEQQPAPTTIRPTEPDNAASPPARPSDPLADERRRREYTSLFASNVALTTRADKSASTALDGADPTAVLGSGGDHDLQTLEAQGRQSLARLNASVAALEQATRPAQPAAPPRSANSQATEGAQERTPAPVPTAPIVPGGSTHRVLEGTVLEAILMTRLDGDFAGPVMCLVTTPLYSHHGDAVLVPSGSKVLGRAKAVDTWGQRRLAVSFHRLLLPDGSSYPLDTFTGLNSIGDTGLKDRVNHHYWSTFGTAAAIGLVSGLAQYVSAGAISGGDGEGNRTVVITGSGA